MRTPYPMVLATILCDPGRYFTVILIWIKPCSGPRIQRYRMSASSAHGRIQICNAGFSSVLDAPDSLDQVALTSIMLIRSSASNSMLSWPLRSIVSPLRVSVARSLNAKLTRLFDH